MQIGNYFKNINSKHKKHFFSGLSFKSSECKKNIIFFAIKGTNVDGNKFINHAIKKGARTIISNNKFQGIKNKVLFIKSKNPRKLLSETSSKIYKNKPKNLIAVTGTNGKSSIADFYFQILNLNKIKVASIGTLGIKTDNNNLQTENTTLDPILLHEKLEMLKKLRIDNVILEASSHGLKQNRLNGLKFTTGIFTNLSRDHLDYHKSYKDYLDSKLILFKNLLKKNPNIITDEEIPQYNKIKNIAVKKKYKIFSVGKFKSNLKVIDHYYKGDRQVLHLKYKNKIYKIDLNLIGKIQVKNILMAMLAAEKSNIKFEKIVKSINKIKNVNGRFEKVGHPKNNSKIILDYAHTPDALYCCLQNLNEQYKNKKISIVFGCGGNRDKTKRAQMGKIANKFCNKVYITDDNPRFENPKKIRFEIKKTIQKNKLFEFSNREKAISTAIRKLNSGEILLVAGRGHEKNQDYGSYKKKFLDKAIILKHIKDKNKLLSSNWKINILNEEINNKININSKIRNASIDSKTLKKNDIFFAIKGKKNNGNFFVKEAFNKGASFSIVNKVNKSTKTSKQILVNDTLNFLTNISKKIRIISPATFIAITGSCGKTSLKELLVNVFSKIFKISYSPKSYNNKYGVPLSLFNINKNDDFDIFEVGMDKFGEIDYLTKIIKPNLAVITNISHAHAKNFKNLNEIAKAKSEIIKHITKDGSIILNADDNFFNLHKKLALRKKLKVFSFSLNKKNTNVYIESIKKLKTKYSILININKKSKFFYVKSIFESNLKNILAAISVISTLTDVFNMNKNIFYNINIPNGRGDISNIKLKGKKIKFIDESYNSNPLSAESAIKNFDSIKNKNGKKNIILGDMLELGKHSKKLHEKLANVINSSKIDNIYVYGNSIKHTFKKISFKKKRYILNNKKEIINLIKNDINNNDYLMIKGSNSTGLNNIANNLKKGNLYAL
jgi:murE/murF fusion protein